MNSCEFGLAKSCGQTSGISSFLKGREMGEKKGGECEKSKECVNRAEMGARKKK